MMRTRNSATAVRANEDTGAVSIEETDGDLGGENGRAMEYP